MDKARVEQLILALGGKPEGRRGGWVLSRCLMAPWLHVGSVHTTPSFGIKINDTGGSRFHCFACGNSGDMLELVLSVRQFNKEDPASDINVKLALELAQEDGDDGSGELPDYETLAKQQVEITKFTEFPELWLDSFLPMHSHPYLHKRGVPKSISIKLDIRFDSSQNRLCFPFRDFNKRLSGLQGRLCTDEPSQYLRYFQYGYNGHRNFFVWMGEHYIDLMMPVVLCEGPFDVARIMEVYPNVLASFSTGLNAFKMKRIMDAPEIITFYDKGAGGDAARASLGAFLKHSSVSHIVPVDEKDPGVMSPQKIEKLLHPFII